MMRVKLNYFIIPALAIIVSAVSNIMTDTGMRWYYQELHVPFFTPPIWVFSIVWHIIYVMSTAAVLIAWNQFPRTIRFWTIIALFAVNALLTIAWSYWFFYQHALGLAIGSAFLIALTVLILIQLVWPLSRLTALLVTPYAAWSAFAVVLNVAIWWLN